MDKISWFNDVYSDIFPLEFDNLFSTIDFESFESKENDSVTQVNNTSNTTSTASERPALTETTLETNNLPAPDESRFPLTSNETVKETLKEAENKNTKRSTTTWMRVWSSWAKSRTMNVNMETISPATLDEILQKYYLKVRKQDGSEYQPDSLKVMQAALEQYLSDKKSPYSLITGREFATFGAVLDAKAKQRRMNSYGKRQNRDQPYNSAGEELFWSRGLLGDHSGVALTNVKFKNLSEQDQLRVSRPPIPLRPLCTRLRSCVDPDPGRRNGKMRTLQRESNEDSYWWLDGEAPKNTSRNLGRRRRFKRSCQTL